MVFPPIDKPRFPVYPTPMTIKAYSARKKFFKFPLHFSTPCSIISLSLSLSLSLSYIRSVT